MTNTIEYPIRYPTMATVKEAAVRFGVSPAYVRKTLPDGQNPLYHDLQPQVAGQRGYAGRVLYAG